MKVCYFGLDENEDLSEYWNEVPEPNPDPRPVIFPNVDRSDEHWETQPDEYYCWRGTRLPLWFE